MIEGFTKTTIRCNGVDLAVHRAGQGRPLLLIHGFPQNHMCWESVAPQLARRHDVIIPICAAMAKATRLRMMQTIPPIPSAIWLRIWPSCSPR